MNKRFFCASVGLVLALALAVVATLRSPATVHASVVSGKFLNPAQDKLQLCFLKTQSKQTASLADCKVANYKGEWKPANDVEPGDRVHLRKRLSKDGHSNGRRTSLKYS